MCWDCYDNPKGDPYKNFRRGAVEVEDFDDDPQYRHPKRRKRKASPRPPKSGCPENDNKAHVYVWIAETETVFYKVFGWHKEEREICCGCGAFGKRRTTERYEKVKSRKYAALFGNGENQPRGEPVGRYRWRNRNKNLYKPTYSYWSWESLDPAYKQAYNKYLENLGYSPWRLIK